MSILDLIEAEKERIRKETEIIDDIVDKVKKTLQTSRDPVHLNISQISAIYNIGIARARRIVHIVSSILVKEGYRVVYTYLGGRWGRFVYPRIQE